MPEVVFETDMILEGNLIVFELIASLVANQASLLRVVSLIVVFLDFGNELQQVFIDEKGYEGDVEEKGVGVFFRKIVVVFECDFEVGSHECVELFE